MGYTLLQISQILLKADRTMYKIGSIAYDDMFNQLDEALDYNRDIIYIYKKAVEYADDFYVGTEKLDTVVEKLGQKIAVYDYGQLNPVYSDATIVNSVIPMGSVLNDLNDVTITNVQDNQILRYNAALQQWVNVGTGNAVRNIQQFTSTAAQTTFTTAFQFDGGLVDIFVNGVKLSPPSYTLFGNYTIILTDACLVGDIVEVVAYENNIAFIDLSQYYVPVGRTLTINGVAYDLSANRSWNVGTVTSVDMTVPTGLTISGNPIVSSGTLALGLAAGYFIPTTASQANWDAAYNDKINSASVTGTTTKTLTLTQQDGGTITASWTDYDTAPVTSVFGRTGAIIATSGDYTTTLVTEGTNLYYLDSRARQALSLTTIGTSGVATYDNTTGIFNIPNYGSVLTGYVPYTGATTNVDLGEFEIKAGQFTLDVSPTGTAVVGTTRWNNNIGSSETTLKGGNVLLKNGVDLVARVVNKVFPNATLTKAAYQAVRVTGAQGQRLAVAYAQANNDNNSADTIGLVCETIATNQEGFIITVGQIEDINTTGSLQGETWVDGDVLYLSPTTPGAITNVKPIAPQHLVIIGYVEYAHANNGKIYVKVMNGWELGELHDVNTTGAVNGSVLKYNGSIWVPSSDIDTGITSLNGLTALSQTFATGTSGTDFNISSATSTHTFNLPTASAVNRGALSSADWTSFDSKQPALSGTGIVKSTSGVISYITDNSANWNTSYDNMIVSAAVTGTTTKTLTLTQQDAGTITASWTDYAPVLSVFGRTGSVIAQSGDYNTTLVTEGTNLYFTDPRVMAAMLTGFTVGSNTAITFNDSVLTAFGKAQAQINTKQNIVTLTTTGSSGSATFISDTLNVPTYTLAGLGGQPQLNGTGFVKISGTTISYDNSTYALDSAVVHNTGTETVAGAKTFSSAVTSTNFVLSGGTGNTGLYYGHTNKVVLANYTIGGGIDFETNGGAINMVLDASGNLDVVGNVTGASIIKSGGTSSQFLKANGSVDSTTYQPAITLTTTGSSGSATLISNTLNVPTYTLSGLGGVPTTRTLTINGTSYDLSANRTWSVGTVTTAAATTGGQVMFSNGATVITSVSGLYFDGVDKLGVGNISPAYNLDVTGTFRSTGNLTAASIIKSGGTSSQYLMADGSTSTLTNPVTGTGTTNYLPKWTSGSALGDSIISASATLVTNNFGTSSLFFGQSGSTRFGFATGTATLAFSTGLPLVLGTFDGQPLVFGTNNTEYARLTDGGNLLVNSTTDNGNRLQVTGNGYFSGSVGIGESSPTEGKLVINNPNGSTNNGVTGNTLYLKAQTANANLIRFSGAIATDLLIGRWGNADAISIGTTGGTEIARFTSSGNLGLGVTPSAWGSLNTSLDFTYGSLYRFSNTSFGIAGNAFYNGSNWIYKLSQAASDYFLESGQHIWRTAPSGTAGNAITFTQAMTLTANGRLLLGTTTEGTYLLDVNGTGRFYGANQDAIQTVFTLGGKNASAQAKELYFRLTAGGTPAWTLQTGAIGTDANVNIFPNGTNGLTIGYSTGAATFSSSVNVNGATSINELNIYSATNAGMSFNSSYTGTTGSDGFYIGQLFQSTNFLFRQRENADIIFETNNGSERMRITSGGRLLVGTTTDSGDYKLQVNGNGFFNSNYSAGGTVSIMTWQRNGGAVAAEMVYNDANTSMNFGTSTAHSLNLRTNGTVAMSIASTGAATFSNLAGTGSRIVVADASGTLSASSALSGYVTGTGTTNYLPKWTSGSAIGNSVIQESSSLIGVNVTPTRVLHLSSSGSNSAIRLDNTVSGRPFLLLYDDSQNLTFINSSDSGYTAFNSGTGASTTKMLLTNGGNLGIGTSSPADLLTLQRNDGRLRFNNTAGTRVLYLGDDFGSGGFQQIYDASGNVKVNLSAGLSYFNGGNLLVGTTTDSGFRLNVVSSSAPIASFSGATNGYIDISDGTVNSRIQNSGGLFIGTVNSFDLNLRTNATTRLTIAASTGAATFSSSVTADRIAIAGAVDSNARLVIGEDSSTTNVGYVRLRGHDVYEGNIYKTATYGIYMDTDTNARPIRIDGSAFITGITGGVGIGTTTVNVFRINVAGHYSAETSSYATDGTGDSYRGGIGWQSTANPSGVLSTLITTINDGNYGGNIVFLNRGVNGGNLNERMRVASGGNLLVGTTTDSGEKLQVNGGAYLQNNVLVRKDSTSDTAIVVSNSGTASATTTMSFILQESAIPQGWFRRYRDFSANVEIGFTDNLLFSGNIDSTKVERFRIKANGSVRYIPMATPASAEAGDVYYDSTTNKLRCYNGTSWNDLF
jgi:predicted heme/steroid binding protein